MTPRTLAGATASRDSLACRDAQMVPRGKVHAPHRTAAIRSPALVIGHGILHDAPVRNPAARRADRNRCLRTRKKYSSSSNPARFEHRTTDQHHASADRVNRVHVRRDRAARPAGRRRGDACARCAARTRSPLTRLAGLFTREQHGCHDAEGRIRSRSPRPGDRSPPARARHRCSRAAHARRRSQGRPVSPRCSRRRTQGSLRSRASRCLGATRTVPVLIHPPSRCRRPRFGRAERRRSAASGRQAMFGPAFDS